MFSDVFICYGEMSTRSAVYAYKVQVGWNSSPFAPFPLPLLRGNSVASAAVKFGFRSIFENDIYL